MRHPFTKVFDVFDHFALFQPGARFLINLLMPLGEPVYHRLRHTLDFKATGMVLDFIAQHSESLAQLMPVQIGGKPMHPVHAGCFKRLPTIFHWVKGCVHDDAMRMQMRVQFPAGLMPKSRRHQIARYPLGPLS